MIWAKYLHHITLHVPLVASAMLAILGLLARGDEPETLQRFLRWIGWAVFGVTTVTVIAGILVAPGWLGGEGSSDLSHHRDLALTTWFVMGLAAGCYDKGIREGERDMRMYGIAMWWVTTFAVVGAGHWGASTHRPELVPWSDVPVKAAPARDATPK